VAPVLCHGVRLLAATSLKSCVVLEAETKNRGGAGEKEREEEERDRRNQGSGEMERRTSAAAANGMTRGSACKIRSRRGRDGG
jgi:hypothetical protein